MFNTQHILYMVISGLLTAALLVWAGRFLKEENKKCQFLKFFALITVAIHYSNLWVEYFANGGSVEVENNHILPVYPCNVVMWMLLAAAFMKNKQGVLFQMLGEFCFIVGFFCSVLGIALNVNFDHDPTLANYSVLKGLLSHSTMLVGCLYMRVGGFIRIRMFNVVSVAAGLAVFVTCGLGVNALYDAFGLTAPDGMFLRENPYVPIPTVILGIGFIIFVFLCLHLAELRLPKEQRWYRKKIVR